MEEDTPAVADVPPLVEDALEEGKPVEEEKADVEVQAADGDGTSEKEEIAGLEVKAEEEGKVAEEGKADEKRPTRTGPLVIGYKTFGMGTEASAYYAYLIKNLTSFQDLNDVSPSLLSTPCQQYSQVLDCNDVPKCP
jgi:hypothetical protein